VPASEAADTDSLFLPLIGLVVIGLSTFGLRGVKKHSQLVTPPPRVDKKQEGML
jgi:hypothetical protein